MNTLSGDYALQVELLNDSGLAGLNRRGVTCSIRSRCTVLRPTDNALHISPKSSKGKGKSVDKTKKSKKER